MEHLRKKLQSRRPTSILGDKQAKIDNLLLDVLILRNGDQEILLFDSTESTVPKEICINNKKDFIHTEPIVLDQMKKKLSGKMPDIFSSLSDNSILDLAIWITNSPCIGCRDIIIMNLKYLQLIFSSVNLRLVLFFSSLYCDSKRKSEITLESLKDWVLKLVEMRISVILGPIIVSKIVPKPKKIPFPKRHKIQERKKRDVCSLTYMKKLKCKIQSTQTTTRFNIFSIPKTFSKINTYTGIPENGLLYFSLTLSDKHHLSKLIPIMGSFVWLFGCLFGCFRLSQGKRTTEGPKQKITFDRLSGVFVDVVICE